MTSVYSRNVKKEDFKERKKRFFILRVVIVKILHLHSSQQVLTASLCFGSKQFWGSFQSEALLIICISGRVSAAFHVLESFCLKKKRFNQKSNPPPFHLPPRPTRAPAEYGIKREGSIYTHKVRFRWLKRCVREQNIDSGPTCAVNRTLPSTCSNSTNKYKPAPNQIYWLT